ncbi:uncharacterized protein LOC141955346 isoform X1 [Athene noctua]|uniref:uncharacterized protein LOC141955040 isoform X1 n=1 Tax=Athene noctua TaxID=126797 RepID=UPI003EC00EAC
MESAGPLLNAVPAAGGKPGAPRVPAVPNPPRQRVRGNAWLSANHLLGDHCENRCRERVAQHILGHPWLRSSLPAWSRVLLVGVAEGSNVCERRADRLSRVYGQPRDLEHPGILGTHDMGHQGPAAPMIWGHQGPRASRAPKHRGDAKAPSTRCPRAPTPRSPPTAVPRRGTRCSLCQDSRSPSPVGNSSMTPGSPSRGDNSPHIPSSGIEQSSSDWVTTDIEVKVRDTYPDSQAVGQIGVIRSVTGGMCSVCLKDSEKVVSISSEHLEPVTPTKNKVWMILG